MQLKPCPWRRGGSTLTQGACPKAAGASPLPGATPSAPPMCPGSNAGGARMRGRRVLPRRLCHRRGAGLPRRRLLLRPPASPHCPAAPHSACRAGSETSAQQLYTLAQLQAASKQQLQRLSAVGESLAADLADLQQVNCWPCWRFLPGFVGAACHCRGVQRAVACRRASARRWIGVLMAGGMPRVAGCVIHPLTPLPG